MDKGNITSAYLNSGNKCWLAGQYEEAARLYRYAAELGNAEAQFNLAICYENGKGVEEDAEKAVKWFRLAAELGDADAQYNLGLCYMHAKGVEYDAEEAVIGAILVNPISLGRIVEYLKPESF